MSSFNPYPQFTLHTLIPTNSNNYNIQQTMKLLEAYGNYIVTSVNLTFRRHRRPVVCNDFSEYSKSDQELSKIAFHRCTACDCSLQEL